MNPITTQLSPRRPYILRAIFDWLVDNELTPYLLVDAVRNGVEVPTEFIQDGKIVLNIAPHAVGSFEMTTTHVQFQARFSGVSRQVIVPMASVLAIYSRENGQGIVFEPEPYYEQNENQIAPSMVKSEITTEKTATSPFKIVK